MTKHLCFCYPKVCCSREQRSGLGSADLEETHTNTTYINVWKIKVRRSNFSLWKSQITSRIRAEGRGDYMVSRIREAGDKGKGVAFTVKG